MKRLFLILTVVATMPVLAQQDVNAAVPTLGEWGLVILVGLLSVCAIYFKRKRQALS